MYELHTEHLFCWNVLNTLNLVCAEQCLGFKLQVLKSVDRTTNTVSEQAMVLESVQSVSQTPCRARKLSYGLMITPMKGKQSLSPKTKTTSAQKIMHSLSKGGSTTLASSTMPITTVENVMKRNRDNDTEPMLMDLIRKQPVSHVHYTNRHGRVIKVVRSERELTHGWWW